jgi:hypothetical protein
MPHDPYKMTPANEAALDRVMPDAAAWRAIYRERVQEKANAGAVRLAMLREYTNGLKGLGYEFVPQPRLVHSERGNPLYFMVFASDHHAGWNIMDWCFQHVREVRRQPGLLDYTVGYGTLT